MLCTDLVEFMVNFVENERPVIISRVQLNNLMNWKCRCKWGRRRGVIVGGWEAV